MNFFSKRLGAGALVALGIAACKPAQTQLTPEQVEDLVAEAYVHCFPIVENYKAIYFYGVFEKSPVFTPMNTIKHEQRLYSPDDKAVVRANNDTYYSTGILDLRAEPVIFKVPEAKDRYYVFQLVSQTTDNFSYIGTRLTGKGAGVYAVTSPNFKGKLPEGVVEIKAPSEFVCVAGRTAVNAQDSNDISAAVAFQSLYEIGVLSKFYPEFKPQTVEAKNFPAYNVATITTIEFFNTLNFLLPYIKLAKEDGEIIKRFEAIGVNTSGKFSFLEENPDLKAAFEAGIKKGLEQVDEMSRGAIGTPKNGWSLWPVQDPYFGTNFKLRTQIAKVAIYANCPIEAYYPSVALDADGNQLSGENSYSLTFPATALPPAEFFWSLTMYDNTTMLMVHNELNRYSIGDRTKDLKYNPDGSLTLYFGSQKPKEGITNWLPAPEGPFNLLMRIYGPKPEVLSQQWTPPGIVKLSN
jgi:hypothetical protein